MTSKMMRSRTTIRQGARPLIAVTIEQVVA